MKRFFLYALLVCFSMSFILFSCQEKIQFSPGLDQSDDIAGDNKLEVRLLWKYNEAGNKEYHVHSTTMFGNNSFKADGYTLSNELDESGNYQLVLNVKEEVGAYVNVLTPVVHIVPLRKGVFSGNSQGAGIDIQLMVNGSFVKTIIGGVVHEDDAEEEDEKNGDTIVHDDDLEEDDDAKNGGIIVHEDDADEDGSK